MNPLSLREALELYKILAPHVPKEYSDELDFAGRIVNSIKSSNNHRAYTDAIGKMTNHTLQELLVMSSTEVLDLFIRGVRENQIIRLCGFCKSIGFADA